MYHRLWVWLLRVTHTNYTAVFRKIKSSGKTYSEQEYNETKTKKVLWWVDG